VEIKVLVGDVCHGGHVKVAASYSVLSQPMGRDLEHRVCGSRLDHACQVSLDIRGIGGGGMEAGVAFFLTDAGVHRADHPSVEAGGP
jgi:hypothetical protein